MKYLFYLSLMWASSLYADTCKSRLDDLNLKTATTTSLDQRMTLQVTSAANRIANKSLWKDAPEVLKISDSEFKSTFEHPKTNLVIFYTKEAEVFGYIKNKNTYWCMKDK